jgi:hypothetical protein
MLATAFVNALAGRLVGLNFSSSPHPDQYKTGAFQREQGLLMGYSPS